MASNAGTGAETPAPDFAAGSWEETPNLILLEAGLSGVMPGQGDGRPPGTVSDTGAHARSRGQREAANKLSGYRIPEKIPSWAPEAIAQDSIGTGMLGAERSAATGEISSEPGGCRARIP